MRIPTLFLVSMMAATPSLATQNEKSPKEIVKDIVEDAKRAPDGTVQPSTGRAKPVENWFGCKPGKDNADNCSKGESQADKSSKN